MKSYSCNTRLALVGVICGIAVSLTSIPAHGAAQPIDRQALVARHNIDWPSLNGEIPLGNGNFAFNADGTGLETFGGNTMSHWCWHSFPLPAGANAADVKPWAAMESGRLKGPTTPPPLLKDWLYLNPHPLNLGRIGFVDAQGKRLALADCASTSRHMDLWAGLLTSRFTYLGEPVSVETCVDQLRDIVAVRIDSPLLRDGRLRVRIDFPSPSNPGSTDPRSVHGPWVGDFANPANHRTEVTTSTKDCLKIVRRIDATTYHIRLETKNIGPQRKQAGASDIDADPNGPNRIDFGSNGAETLTFTCLFSSEPSSDALPGFDAVRTGCAKSWPEFWRSGGAIDLSGSRDPRWKELERRIVLSQYELAVQSAGDNFPAESGLTGRDTWSGKFHLEMTWWHMAHYALWNRWPLADRSMGYYRRNAHLARAIAENFGYQGLMWPKSTGPTAINDGYFREMALMWKQPAPIYFAELEYRIHPTQATLDKWKDLVFGTAQFMADYPTLDPETGVYSMDPCWPMCERPICANPIFELGYWRWGLLKAQEWRARFGLPAEPHWDEVVNHLAQLPVKNGLYVYRADQDDTYRKRSIVHLDQVAVFAMLPSFPGLDHDTAHRTVLEVAKQWKWDALWGWDFPLLAMGAARMNEPQTAVDALFIPSVKNEYDERGLRRKPYLPGNGGLLYAVALMAAGWDGAPNRNSPGFPDDGSWTVRWEGLNRAP